MWVFMWCIAVNRKQHLECFINHEASPRLGEHIQEKLIIRTFWTISSDIFFNVSTIFEDIFQNVRYYSSSILYEMG